VVELQDGRRIAIDRPVVAINSGGVSLLSAAIEPVDSTCRDMRPLALLTGEEVRF
jgi:hypothetical protein